MRTPNIWQRADAIGLGLVDGGQSRRKPRLMLREGIVGCIAKRPRGAAIKPTGRFRDHAEGRVEKRGDPLMSIERVIADACQLRDAIPPDRLEEYDRLHVYGQIQGSVAMLCAQGIDASNARRATITGASA